MALRLVGAAGMLVALVGCQFDPNGIGSDDDDDVDASAPGRDAPAAPDAAPEAPDAGPPEPDAEPAPTAFAKTITLDGAQVAGNLDDFPVYLALTDADLAARSEDDASDIYFTDASGTTPLDHEIQRWDPSTGALEVWVRIPQLTGGADLDIEMRYGDAGAAVAPDPAGVWQNGFVAVWHMEESPGGGGDAIVDSLGAFHGTGGGGMNGDDLVDATLGRGLAFDGNNDEITFSNPLPGASAHTISAWVDQEPTGNNDALVVLGDGMCGQARWLHSRYTGGNVGAGFYCDDFTSAVDIQNDGPTLVHWTYDESADSRLYVNGAQEGSPLAHAGTQDTSGDVGRIGNAPAAFGTNMGLSGVVDEVRIATVARTDAWAATEFANQRDPAGFVTVGSERALPPD